jgi:virginiamycin A acetyltransferase
MGSQQKRDGGETGGPDDFESERGRPPVTGCRFENTSGGSETAENHMSQESPGQGMPSMPVSEDYRDLKACRLHRLLLFFSRNARLRPHLLSLALRWEGGDLYSSTARAIFKNYCGVRVGAYSYGSCFEFGAFPPGTLIGRYVSIADGVRAFQRNHPMDRLSLHPFFYNRNLGVVPEDNIPSSSLIIDPDVWIGCRAIIVPGCSKIGVGAVVGAGAVVTQEVPPFAVVAGNPARLIRMRFPAATCDRILESRWWEMGLAGCRQFRDHFTGPLQPGEWLRRLHP